MFRKSAGYKARIENMTLFVGSDFDEWRILIETPDGIIHGGRQFSEAKAKECAASIVESYMRDEKQQPLASPPQPEWSALEPGAWLNWRP
jgi:hypothetical protein